MSNQDNNGHVTVLPNLKISTGTIFINPQTFTSQIIISNLDPTYTIYFKIKTKIQKLFDVKPCLGSIKPAQQQIIVFKALKKIEQNQIPNIEQNSLFLLQAVNQNNSALTKQEEEVLWKQIKAKKANLQLGYYSVKLGIVFSNDNNKQKELIPLFNKALESKIDNKNASESNQPKRPLSKMSILTNQNQKQFYNKRHQLQKDQQLSKKYEELSQRQQQLINERSKLFDSIPPPPKKAKGAFPVKVIIILILAFILGNLLYYIKKSKQHDQTYILGQNWIAEQFS